MPRLLIKLKKKEDNATTLSCTRADGSVTWQTSRGKNGEFFALHDLTHYAVETVLKHHKGFYGLLAEGWEFSDFGTPWPRGPIPTDADPSELIVGFLDAERAIGAHWDAGELARTAGSLSLPESLSLPDDGQLERIRTRRAELFAQWETIPVGQTMELEFDD